MMASAAARGGGDMAVRATPTTGRDRFIYVWLELVETQHAAAQAAAAITLSDGSEAARKVRALLATTQRVSALVDSADELLYMHVLPSGKEAAAAAQAPPKAAPAKKQEEVSHNLHGCCCCCPSRSGGGRDAKRGGGAAHSVALSTRSRKPRRSLTDSESDRDEDDEDAEEDENRTRGRRSSRRQRRRRAQDDDSDDDRSRSLDDEMRGNDVRFYDALVANRIRMSNPLARPPSGMEPEQREPGASTAGGGSQGRRSLTPRNRGDGVGMATRGRSPARSDRPSGAGSLSPARGHPYRQPGAQSPAENNSGRKRRRTQADRQPSPSHQGSYPGSAPIEDGLDRMSKNEAVGLTAEAVLDMRWNFSQKEYKVKWVGIDKPVWIARRKCPNQAALLIEVFTKGLRRQKKTGRQPQQEKVSSSSTKSSKKGEKNSGTESESLYTVEKLIGVRTKHNKRQFLVRWDGYDSSEDTWEYVDELRKYVPDIVKDYEAYLKRERERKAQEAERISERTPAKEVPARDAGNGDAEGDERDQGADEETLDKEQQRMLQVIRGGSDVDEEEDDDDGMDHQEDSDDEDHDDRDHTTSGEQLTRYSQGRYSKPLFLSRSGQQDSEEDDDDDGDDGDDGDAHEPEHDLDEDMDDDNDEDDDDDDDHVSIDFSGDTGMRRYTPITSTRPTSGAGSVVESAKELLRRLRA